MRAGARDKYVSVLKRTRVRDERSGELIETYASIGEAWAQLVDGRGLERYASAQMIAEATCGFRFDWAPALLTLTPDEHRVRMGELEFEILGTAEIQRRQGVMVLCIARAEGLTAEGLEPEA